MMSRSGKVWGVEITKLCGVVLLVFWVFNQKAAAQNPIHVTYLWHMHQPIYYPYESVYQTDLNGRFNFNVKGVHDARIDAYGQWPKNAVQQGTDLPNAGVQVSFSGSLMENMDGLYGTGWREHYRWGRNGLRTARNNPRLDLVGIAYHHSLMPLTTKESMRMQVRLHKEAYKDVWNTGGSYSKGFWPPECAFDVNMVPALVDEGIQWVIVDNGHFDRACQNYPWAPASSIRPNKADQLNPDPSTMGSQWVQLNNVWAPTKVSAPWGYQPRYVQYVDPWSNPTNPTVRRIIAVPAGRYEGNENARGGYGAFKPENVWGSKISANNNPQRPMLLLCHSDGDNFGMLNADAYNGQHGNFLNMVRSNPNFKHTSVQDYLELYPVPSNDVIHVERGSWVGIDGGTPYFDKWRENNAATNGEHPDLWSWSVVVAAANRVIHADNLDNNYSMNDVRWGIGSDTAKAWRYYLQAETSCYWYWDFDRNNPWDGNATRGANMAINEANKVISRYPGIDRVGPTIWPPQRDIYNPGGLHFNEATNQPSNFNVFTFVDDVSGLQNVKLYWRTDNDGENPILEYDNELYARNTNKVSAWNIVDMTGDWYPTVQGPQVPDPVNRAMRYRAPINGQNNVLIDYFVEAVDNKGNTNRSDIDHVWVGAANSGGGGGGGAGGPVTVTPSVPVAGETLTITYDPASRGLAAATTVNIHHGFNGANWTGLPGVAMTRDGAVWKFTYVVPTNATTIAMVFNNGSGTWDNNNNANWNFSVISQPPSQPPAVPTGLTANGNSPSSVSLSWSPSAASSGYVVLRDNVQVATPTGTSYLDTSLQPDTTYAYSIAAINSAGTSSPCFPVFAATFFLPVSNNALRLVNPTNGATVGTNMFRFRGHAGLGLTSGLRWSNTISGQTGSISFTGVTNSSGWKWEADLPLGNGSNNFVFSATYLTNGPAQQTGSDSPINYSGWSSGFSNGLGFGAWTITTSNSSAGSFLADSGAPQLMGADVAMNYGSTWTNGATGGTGFAAWSLSSGGSGAFLLANPTNGGIGGMSARAFQLRAPTGGGNTFATANRDLSQPMAVGQTLSFLWGMNWDSQTTNGAKGFSLFAGTNELVNVNNGSTEAITCNGTNVQFGYGTNAMRWSFKLLTASSLEIRANDRDGNGAFVTNLTVASAPTSLRFYAANMEADTRREPYFDDFRIESPPANNIHLGSATKGFGLWANGGASVTARRNLPASFDSGDSFTIRIDNNWIDTGSRIGLALATAGGANRMDFYFIGGQSTYRIDDATVNRDSGLAYTDAGLQLTLTMTGSNTYSLNTGGSVVTGTLGSGGPITQLVVYNNNGGTGAERYFYVGEMSFSEPQITSAVTTLSTPNIMLQAVTAGIPNSWWDLYSIAIGDRTATADPDRDGWSNAQEFAFGLRPDVPGEKLIEVDTNNPTKIVFLQRDTGVSSYVVRAANELGSGFTNTVTATLSTNTNNVPAGYKRYEATFPSGNRGFLKVDATVSP